MQNSISKYKYQILFAILIIAGVFYNNSKFTSTINNVNIQLFESILHDKEQKTDAIVDSLFHNTNNKTLAEWVNKNSETIDYLYEEQGLIFVVYYNSNPVYWTSNSIVIPDNIDTTGFKLQNFGNLYAEVRIKSNDSITVAGLIGIMQDYHYENKFLKNGFHKTFNISNNYFLKTGTPHDTYAVFNNKGEYLFSIEKQHVDNTVKKARVSAIIFLAALFFLLLYFKDKLKNRNFSFPGFIIFTLTLIGLRVSMLIFRIPGFFDTLPVFNPDYFSYPPLFPSLGDLLITVVLITYLIFIFYSKVQLHLSGNGKGKKIPAILFYSTVFAGYVTVSHIIFTGLIVKSNFEFEAIDILNLSVFSFVGYFILLLLFVGLLLLIDKAICTIKNTLSLNKAVYIFVFAGLFSGLILVLLQQKELLLSEIFVFIIIIYWTTVRYRKTPVLFDVIILIVLFSVFSTYFIRKQNFSKRIETGKSIAKSLAKEQDPVAEIVLDDVMQQMQADTVIKNYLNSNLFDYDNMLRYIKGAYFTGYLDRYFFNLTVCNSCDSILLDEENNVWEHCYGFFDMLLKENGIKTDKQNLYYLKDATGNLNYFMQVKINHLQNKEPVTLFFDLMAKPNFEVLGYPELLIDKPVSIFGKHKYLSYAKYIDNRLVLQSGEFPYALDKRVYNKTNKEFVFFQSENYDHLLYNTPAGASVIVSFPTINFFNIIISFNYIFFFLLIQTIFLLIIGQNFTNLIRFKFTIKNKIIMSMLFILFVSLAFVGGGAIIYTHKQFEEEQIDILGEKVQSVLVELEHKIAQYGNIYDIPPVYLNNLLVKLSNVFYSDINLYDINGNLAATSRKEIFERNLTGKKINAIAYRELVLNKKARIVHKEHIGNLEYYSAYVPFINNNNNLTAYLNLPYFSKEDVLRKELLGVTVAVINIYVLMLILSIALAVYISNKIVEPLKVVSERISSIDLSKKNERIDYNGNDEIAELVAEYNRMLEALDKSARLLAKSERESAWREMARQIAHEIKNPLTPMKLSIQLLDKSWNNNDKDFSERFKRSTQTLIEQIDSLSAIASAFSQFAQMPVVKFEKVDIIERINRSIQLYKQYDNLQINVNTPQHIVFVKADNEKMLQIFNNLIKNAVQAIPQNKQGVINVSVSEQADFVTVEIEDNGSGIPPEMKDKLFQPYFTTKSSGTGLGLAIVKNIIEELNGKIDYSSDENKGTVFFISLPVFKN
jgi:signal transduction histidine kinase